MAYLCLDILEMSEGEEIGSSTILGIACDRIQCLTLKAWCVAHRENESSPGGEMWIYVWQINSFLGGEEGRLPQRSGSSITRGKAEQRRSCRIQEAPHADGCAGTVWHPPVGWAPLQRASEINDILTSMSRASLRLQSHQFRNISGLKGMQCSAKQEMCPHRITGARTRVAFLLFILPTLCPGGPLPLVPMMEVIYLFLPGRAS